jgi:hypothetical protein
MTSKANPNVAALTEARDAAQRRLWGIDRERAAFLRERQDAFLVALTAETAGLFDDRLAVARAELAAAEALADEAIEKAALAEEREVPAGTLMEEWKTPRHTYGRGPKELTGRKGVLEIITRESVHPGNIREWSQAKVGQLVVRILKKNGEPGTSYVSDVWGMRNCWKVAGSKGAEE